jgi:hypothetical protein
MIPSIGQQAHALAQAWHAYRNHSAEAAHRAAMARRTQRAIDCPRSAVQTTVREILHSTADRRYSSGDMQAALAARGINTTRSRAGNMMRRLAQRGETTRVEIGGEILYHGRGAQ